MSEKEHPGFVSVIMPCFRMGQFVAEALASVAAQTHAAWEVIAVDDDGPADGTREAFESFARQFPQHRVEFLRHARNRGVSAARNTAIQAARGEFLAFLDPDDAFKQHHLETALAGLVRESADVAAARCDVVGPATTGYCCRPFPTEEEKAQFPSSLFFRNFIQPSAVVMRRSSLPPGPPWFTEEPALQHIEDWDLWIRLAAAGRRFLFLEHIGSSYRLHAGSASLDGGGEARVTRLRRTHAELFADHLWRLLVREKEMNDELARQFAQCRGSWSFRIGWAITRPLGCLLDLARRAFHTRG
jgi:GT2 family glycosyltransferase